MFRSPQNERRAGPESRPPRRATAPRQGRSPKSADDLAPLLSAREPLPNLHSDVDLSAP